MRHLLYSIARLNRKEEGSDKSKKIMMEIALNGPLLQH